MTSKHKIIGLTSLVFMASTQFTAAEMPMNNAAIMNIHKFYLGPRSSEPTQGMSAPSSTEVGESGEGGLENVALETDDMAFITALKIIHAHYAIGLKLYKAQQFDIAESFFGHPITEVLTELEPAFEYRKIQSINESMYNLLEIVQNHDNLNALEAEVNQVLHQIKTIQSSFKKSNPQNFAKIMAHVNADLLRRSKLEFIQAIKINSLGHLQDSIGYFDVAYALFKNHKDIYQQNGIANIDKIDHSFADLAPYFADFSNIDTTINTKKVAGTIAKIELFLLNI